MVWGGRCEEDLSLGAKGWSWGKEKKYKKIRGKKGQPTWKTRQTSKRIRIPWLII